MTFTSRGTLLVSTVVRVISSSCRRASDCVGLESPSTSQTSVATNRIVPSICTVLTAWPSNLNSTGRVWLWPPVACPSWSNIALSFLKSFAVYQRPLAKPSHPLGGRSRGYLVPIDGEGWL